MPVRVLIVLLLLCVPARAADPWTPFRKMFPGKPPPGEMAPLPLLPEPDASAAIERALLDAELQAAVKKAQEAAERAEEAARGAEGPSVPPPPVPLPKPKPKSKAKPLDIRPKAKVTANECAQIGVGIGFIGKEGVRREAIARGHSATEIDEVQKACGF